MFVLCSEGRGSVKTVSTLPLPGSGPEKQAYQLENQKEAWPFLCCTEQWQQ